MSEFPKDAACIKEDPELFFPVGKSEAAQDQAVEAKAVCHRCIVRDECLEKALTFDDVQGIWGGLTEKERKGLKTGLSHMGSTALNG